MTYYATRNDATVLIWRARTGWSARDVESGRSLILDYPGSRSTAASIAIRKIGNAE